MANDTATASYIASPTSATATALNASIAYWRAYYAQQVFTPPPPNDRPEIGVSTATTSALGASPVTYKPAIVDTGSTTASWDGASDTKIRYGGGPGTTTRFRTANGDGSLALYTTGKPGGDAQAAAWPLIYEFLTEAPAVELLTYHLAGDYFMVEVNGALVSDAAAPQASYAAGDGRINLVFPAPAPSGQARRVRIFASSSHGLRAVRVPAGYTITKPPVRPTTLAIIGDSWVNGAGEVTNVDSFGAALLHMIDPAADVILCGIGGRGWVTSSNGGGTANPYSASVPAVLASSPGVIVFYGSQNDGSNIGSTVSSTLALVSSVSKVLVIPTLLSGYSAQATAIRTATLAANRTYVDVAGIIHGSGYLDAPVALDGNKSRYVYSAGDLHMIRDGHRYAREAIFRAIPDTVTA